MVADPSKALLIWLHECNISQIPIVGGKNASLGEMIQNLESKGIRIPGGFATTAYAFREFMAETGLNKTIESLLMNLNISNVDQVRNAGRACRAAILSKPFPSKLSSEIAIAYKELSSKYGLNGRDVDVAVRSSATAEDLPNASFAGQVIIV
jgi:pyruvate, water dikinase